MSSQMSANNFNHEEWRDVTEFNGAYQISNMGRLKSMARSIEWNGTIRHQKEKMLSQIVNKKGYIEYQITYKGKHYSRKAHRLVAEAFIPNVFNKPHVNHIDGVKTNNNVANLEWCTNLENRRHAYQTGLYKTRKVVQLNMVGDIVKIYSSTGDAEKQTGHDRVHIYESCVGKKRKTYHGYKWMYFDDYTRCTVIPLMAIFSQLNIKGVKPWNDMTQDEKEELIRKDQEFIKKGDNTHELDSGDRTSA